MFMRLLRASCFHRAAASALDSVRFQLISNFRQACPVFPFTYFVTRSGISCVILIVRGVLFLVDTAVSLIVRRIAFTCDTAGR